MNQITKKTGSRDPVRQSVILHFLTKIVGAIYAGISGSFAAFLLTGDGKQKNTLENSGLFRLFNNAKVRCKAGFLLPMKRFFNKTAESSVLLHAISRFMRLMFDLPLFFYGVTFFSFGLYTVIFELLLRYGMGAEEIDRGAILLGASLAVIFFPMLFSPKPLSQALGESRIGHFLLCRVFGFSELTFRPEKFHRLRASIPLLIGIALGLISIVLPPRIPLLCFAAFTALYLILKRPETGVILLFALLPFLETSRIAGLILLTSVSYLLKLISGKRTFALTSPDIAVLGFGMMLFLGGFISVSPGDSLRPALLMTGFIGAYFLVVNTVRSVDTVRRCIGVSVFSVSLVSLFGLYEYLFSELTPSWLDTSMFPDIPGRMISTFGNPNVLGEFLVLTFPFLLAALFTSGRARNKVCTFILVLLSAACILFTWSRGAWIGAILALVLFLLLVSRKSVPILLLAGCTVPLLSFLIPETVLSRFLSIGNLADSSTAYRVHIWQGCLGMMRDFFFTGIGTGTDTFRAVYPDSYALPAIEGALHSHNLFFEILIELGIFGLIVFCAVLFFSARAAFSFLSSPAEKDETDLRLYTCAGIAGFAALLAEGMTDYIWYNYRVFCFFWIMLALVSCISRCAMRERVTHFADDDLIPEE